MTWRLLFLLRKKGHVFRIVAFCGFLTLASLQKLVLCKYLYLIIQFGCVWPSTGGREYDEGDDQQTICDRLCSGLAESTL
jgi:hypothetical protein